VIDLTFGMKVNVTNSIPNETIIKRDIVPCDINCFMNETR